MKMQPITTDLYKACLRTFATGITVITTQADDDTLYGVTINSFNSVSLSPPLVLFSINTSSNLNNILINNNFCVNILAKEQHDLSNCFATPKAVDWHSIPHQLHSKGYPILENTSATMLCIPYAHYDGGDHTIIVGEVTESTYNAEREPLIYYESQYCTIGEPLS